MPADTTTLAPCPFCGGSVDLEEAEKTHDGFHGERRWWGVVCRNTTNRGGSCAIQQRPSASPEAAIERWNRRAQAPAPQGPSDAEPVAGQCRFMGEKEWKPCAAEHVGMVLADPRYAAEGYEVRHLYAAPQPPAALAPLTPQQRRKLLDRLGASAEGMDGETWDQMVIDAIEAAHGITGTPPG